jgi:lipopolysaccharide export system protein LptC
MKQIISLIIFLVLAVIAWWSVTNPYNDNDQLPQSTGKEYAEVFMNEFEMTAMNEMGKPDYILKGSYMQRYSDSDDTEIKQPVFHLLQEDRQWLVSAEKAIINDEEEIIRLSENVVMKQHNVESAITIHTQHMLINLKTQVARTNTRVDITQGNSRMESKGMIFNNITSELELLSSVHGYYTPYD